ncbi:MAG: bacteriohemerythrin [Firmicutes bacterium]|nr:bacteriohemerythrin [Bacillota bacterium]
MAIQWTDALLTGVEEIDNQHKEMFRWINHLLDSCHQGRGTETVGEVLEFLEGYSRSHFAREEEIMLANNYDRYEEHKKQHQQFIENLAEVKGRFEAEGPGVHIVVITNRVIAGWLNTHIRRVDKPLGEFLRQRVS